MSNFSIKNIGAFELNSSPVLLFDGALEGITPIMANPTSLPGYCANTVRTTTGCSITDALHVPSDAALEGVMPLIASPTAPAVCTQTLKIGTMGCVSHDDAALEATAIITMTPTHGVLGCPTFNAQCGLVDDGALEASVGGPPTLPTANCRVPTGGNPFGCVGHDDAALEAAGGNMANPHTAYMPNSTAPCTVGCITTDDGALEASVGGPPTVPTYTPGNCVPPPLRIGQGDVH